VDWQDREAAQLSIIKNWACDAVLGQNTLLFYNLLPTLKRLMPRIKLMDVVHAIDEKHDIVTCTAGVSPYLDLRVAISQPGRRRVAREASGGVVLVPNGVDLEHFRQSREWSGSGTGRILFAGRLDEVKRPLLLVEIARALRSLRPASDFRFVVAGDGPEDQTLRTAVRAAGLEDVFEFLGHVSDLAPVLADSALLVIPSRSEGVPLVMLEAMASGRPVVASDVGAIREVLDDTTGFLIPRTSGESRAFAVAIDRLLSDRQLRRQMGKRGRRLVEQNHDKTASREAYRRLFEAEAAEGAVTSPACAKSTAGTGPASLVGLTYPY
jgi:glycosyltransferase involved in cell wall biosynthesis